MKLSKNAEQILLAAYNKANEKNSKTSDELLNIPNEEFKKALEELEGANDFETVYIHVKDLHRVGFVNERDFCRELNGVTVYDKGIKYLEEHFPDEIK